MISFQATSSPNERTAISELDNSLKKRKREDSHTEVPNEKGSEPENTKSINEIELQLETPLPLEWQQCLDIRSGEIHFYNTRTHKRTFKDPRESTESKGHMSLDLQLNLPYESQRKDGAKYPTKPDSARSIMSLGDFLRASSIENNTSGGVTRNFSGLEVGADEQEMVATVCKKCHMLVLLCKNSPACPNCKFMHTADHQSQPAKVFKQGLSLLC